MKIFSEALADLDDADHVQRISLFHGDGSAAGVIENKPGSQGSIKVYYHLYKRWGSISVEAAHEGQMIYAEHTHDARLNPGKHPNIDRLFSVVADNDALTVEVLVAE